MQPMYYIGLDVHKRKISCCVKDGSGQVFVEGWLSATRLDLDHWMRSLPQPWSAALEASVSYNKQRLHKAGYFRELLASNPDIDAGLGFLLRLCRETVVRLQKTESALVRSLERDPLLVERVQRLMTIPVVGPITALTWALEIGEVQRFSSIKKAISYCGLCGAERSSGNTVQRTPLSKQRNKHLQTTLIEAAKMAPRNSPELAMLYDKEKQKGNANRATLAVARKLAYLMAVDRGQRNFQVVETSNIAA
jgi:transposase